MILCDYVQFFGLWIDMQIYLGYSLGLLSVTYNHMCVFT